MKIRFRLRLLVLIYRHVWFLPLIPLVILYVLMPVSGELIGQASGKEEAAVFLRSALHFLLPAFGPVLMFPYLSAWIGSDAKKALHCGNRRRNCLPEVILLLSAYGVSVFPGILLLRVVSGLSPEEYLAFLSELLFFAALVYLFALLFRNTMMGILPGMLYMFFCMMFHRDSSMQGLCLLRPDQETTAGTLLIRSLPLAMISLMLLIGAGLLEKRQSKVV